MDSPPNPVTAANLSRTSIVEMSRADDLVSFVSPESVPLGFQVAQKN